MLPVMLHFLRRVDREQGTISRRLDRQEAEVLTEKTSSTGSGRVGRAGR